MRTEFLAVLVVFLALPELLQAQEEPVPLKYNYPAGKKVIYRLKGNMDIGGGVQAKNLSEYTSTERLTGTHEDGSFGVSVVLSDVHESIFVVGRLIRMEVLGLLAGEAFQFDLTPTGTLKNFVPPPLKSLPMTQREALQIVVTNLELSYASLYPELPKAPVRVGDSWTARREYKVHYEMMSAEGSQLTSSVYKIKAAKKKDGFECFEVEETAQVTVRVHLNFGELSVIADGTGTGTGKWLFDYERGLVQSYEGQSKTDMQAIPVGVPDAKPVESTFRGSFKRELKKIE